MNRILRWSLIGLATITVLAATGATAGYLYLRGSLPQTQGDAVLAGLDRPVEIVRDGDGIPTIRAQSEADAYRALGYVHAQDRLWQMEFMRRTVAGRLSEVVGPGTLPIDRFMRVMNFRHQAEAQQAHLSQETLDGLEAYTEGVNAYLETDPVLPLEFHIMRSSPEPWSVADSLSWTRVMALQLSGNWRGEVNRMRLAERLEDDDIDLLFPGDDGDERVTLKDTREAARTLPLKELAEVLPPELQTQSASNAWIVSGEHSSSGAPLLANDPHLALQTPGYWYLARIELPGDIRVGATSPGVPFHILGRNSTLAWGMTTTHSDTQDLFIERIDPEDSERYLTPDGPRDFETREEVIAVRGQDEPERLSVRHTRHGPVISDAVASASGVVDEGHVLALAWPALREDDLTPQAIHEANRARDVPEALEALQNAHSPQQNVHLADSAGNIAVTAPARVPVRKRGDGTMPVPGWDDSYGWDGFIPLDALPQSVNPPEGRLINANNRLVPPNYPYQIAAHWPPPDRADRIAALLDRAANPSAKEQMWDVMLDSKSPAADLLLPKLLAYPPASTRGEEAMDMLRAWDGKMDHSRAEPLIFTAWVDHLNRSLLEERLGDLFQEFARPQPRTILRILESRRGWCRHDDIPEDSGGGCSDVVALSLEDAMDSLQRRFGGDPMTMEWGQAHFSDLPHPMLSRVPGLNLLFGTKIPTDGGDETVNRGGARYDGPEAGRYRHIHGAGLRAVHDLGRDPGSSRFVIADGQSGNPLSPHYGGFTQRWRDGRFVELVGETQDGGEVLRLTPAHH